MYLPMYHPVSVKKFQSHGKLSCQKSAREWTLRTIKTLTKESEREQKRENKKKGKWAPTGNIILFKVLYTSLLTPMYYMTKQNHNNKGGGGREEGTPLNRFLAVWFHQIHPRQMVAANVHQIREVFLVRIQPFPAGRMSYDVTGKAFSICI